jgi:MFS family permease
MQPKNFESRIQDLVYNVDVGIGLRLIKVGLYVLSVLALMTLYTASEFWGLKNAEAMDQAQIARQIMTEGTFTTKFIRPAAVWLFEKNGEDPQSIMLKQPDIVHPPVYPWVLSRAFHLFGNSFSPEKIVRAYPPEQWAVIPLGHTSTLLTGLFLFLTARRFFERRIAILAVSLFFVSEVVWSTSVSGTSLSLAALFSVIVIYLSLLTAEKYLEPERTRRWLIFFFLTGFFCALTLLTRYSAGVIILVPVLLFGMTIPNNGWKIGFSLLGVALLLALPWFIRNYVICGHFFGLTPYLALNVIDPSFTMSFERSVTPSLEAWRHLVQVQWVSNLREFYESAIPSAGNGIMVALFVATFFFRFIRGHVHALRIGLLAAIVLLVIIAGFFGEQTFRVFYIFWPMIILYGLTFFYLLLDRLQLTLPIFRTGLMAAVITLTALPVLLTLLPPRVGFPYPPYYPSYTTLVTQMLSDDELLCTDMPWATAWYGNRSSVLLPASVEEFYKINDLQKRISGIYFTTLTRNLPYVRTLETGPYSTWFPIFRERVPVDFPLTEAFFISNRDQLFLTDRPRWQR